MTIAQPPSSAARAPAVPNKPVGDGADEYPFTADPVGFDVYRLDIAVDALRGADISNHRDELTRIAANLADIVDPHQ